MAMTAVLTVTPEGQYLGRRFTVTLTVSNSSGAAVYITSVMPHMMSVDSLGRTVAGLCGAVLPGQAVPATGSLVITWENVVLATSAIWIKVGATVYCSDGTVIEPTAAFLGILDNSLTTVVGGLEFNQMGSSAKIAAL